MPRIDGDTDEPFETGYTYPDTAQAFPPHASSAHRVDFSFIRAWQTGTKWNNSSGVVTLERNYRATLLPVPGMLIYLTGTQRNLAVRWDPAAGALALSSLQIPAPENALWPAISSPPGTGEIFGDGFRWLYRAANKDTGERSGLSPLADEKLNLGQQVAQTANYLGVRAVMHIPGVTGAGYGITHFEVFRNLSEGSVYFYVGEVVNPGSGSYATFVDNVRDEVLAVESTTGLYPNPRHSEGEMPPVTKAYRHPNGRVLYYGIRPMPHIRTTGDFTAGSDEFTSDNGDFTTDVRRVGQALKLIEDSGGDAIEDAPDIVLVVDPSNHELRLNKPLEVLDEMVGDAFDSAVFEIRDTRDERTIWVSEPNKPTQIDPTSILAYGWGSDDGVKHIFGMGGTTFLATRRRIYGWVDDSSEDPLLTTRAVVVADEGTMGFWCNAETPFGLVFLNERGVRLFNGQAVVPLGSQTLFNDFLPKRYLTGSSWDNLSESLVFYDPEEHLVHVTLSAPGSTGSDRTLVFDPEAGVWRGWWRRRLFNAGQMLSRSGALKTITGDDLGNLMYEQAQYPDMIDPAKVPALTGRLNASGLGYGTGVALPAAFSADEGVNYTTGTQDYVGCPVLVETTTTGVWALNWISRVTWEAGESQTNFYLAQFWSDPDGIRNGAKVLFGWVEWQATTAEVDSGDVVNTEDFVELWLRFNKPAALDGQTLQEDHLEVLVSADGGTYLEAKGSKRKGEVPQGVFRRIRVDADGHTFSIRARGRSIQGVPEITQAFAQFNVRQGTGDRGG